MDSAGVGGALVINAVLVLGMHMGIVYVVAR